METNHRHNQTLNIFVQAMKSSNSHEIISSIWSCEKGSVVIVKDNLTGEEFTLKMTIFEPSPAQVVFESLIGKEPKHFNRIKNL